MEKFNNKKKSLVKRDKVKLKQKSDNRLLNYYENLLKKPNSLIVDVNSHFIDIKYISLLKISELTSIKPCEAVEFALFLQEENKARRSSVKSKIMMLNEKIKTKEALLPLLEDSLMFNEEELKEREMKENDETKKEMKNKSSPVKIEEIKESPEEKQIENKQQVEPDLNLDANDEVNIISIDQKLQESVDEGKQIIPEKTNIDESKNIIKNQSSPVKNEEFNQSPEEKLVEMKQRIVSDLNLDIIDEVNIISTEQNNQESVDEGKQIIPEKTNIDESKNVIKNQSSPVKNKEIKESPKKKLIEKKKQIKPDLNLDINDEVNIISTEQKNQESVDEDKELIEIKKNNSNITPKKEKKNNINLVVNKNINIPKEEKIDGKNKDEILHIQNKYKSNVLNNMSDNHNAIKKNPLLFVKIWQVLYLILSVFGLAALAFLICGYIKMKKISFKLFELLLISEISLSIGLGIAGFLRIQQKELTYFTLINVLLITDSALFLFCLLTPIFSKITDFKELIFITILLNHSYLSIIFNLLGITICLFLTGMNVNFLDFEKNYENAAKQSEGESLIDKNEEEIKKETLKI